MRNETNQKRNKAKQNKLKQEHALRFQFFDQEDDNDDQEDNNDDQEDDNDDQEDDNDDQEHDYDDHEAVMQICIGFYSDPDPDPHLPP